jgi:hypothetical protein
MTQEPKGGTGHGSDSERSTNSTDYSRWIREQLTVLEEAFDVVMTTERKALYTHDLMEIEQARLRVAFTRARRELKFFPKIAELRELAGAGPEADGRPGPEEAWAVCPKSEDETVVWTTEMAAALGMGARDLLRDGDAIGARMAFKEAYTRLVGEARARGDKLRWTASMGWDKAARVAPLAEGVERGRITREYAFNLLAIEQHAELRMALPAAPLPQLKGEKTAELPGLAGVLLKMRMEGTVPEGLDPKAKQVGESRELTPEEVARRKELLKAQAEQLRKRREKDSGGKSA